MMKKNCLFLFFLIVSVTIAQGQYYYISHRSPGQNPKDLNQEDEILGVWGWTTILQGGLMPGTRSNVQTIPFTFNFGGAAVTNYWVSNTGVLSFDLSNTSSVTHANEALPSPNLPDKSICIWGIQGSGTDDVIRTKTFGRAPNRQHWISFSSYTYNNSWTYWSIVLEEGRGNIYFVDQRHQNAYSGLTIGIQLDTTTAFQLRNSPHVPALAGQNIKPVDNVYYEFIFGQQPQHDIVMKSLYMETYQHLGNAPFSIRGEFLNRGSDSISSYDLHYRLNGGAVQSATIAKAGIYSGEMATFESPQAWVPAIQGTYELEVWTNNINGHPDANPKDDTARASLVLSPAIPNRMDEYTSRFPILKVIADRTDRLNSPMDLDFHPDLRKKELWVINYDNETTGGSTVTFHHPGMPNQRSLWRRDGNAWHFMSLPTGIAFSSNGNFATSPGVFDANHNGGIPFTGPTLWSSDSAIYAQPSGGNGSHLDMLHETPVCLGIESEQENAFWVIDGYHRELVRCDFVADHGPGNDDHSDGRIRRVTDFPITMISNDIPSHLVLDKSTGWLYIVDGGGQRILRMDIHSGNATGTPSIPLNETIDEYVNWSNTSWEVVIDSGLVEPSGIEIIADRLLVSDYATGIIHIFQIDSTGLTRIKRIHTQQPGITGLKIGPDGYIWYVNSLRDELVKIETAGVSISEQKPETESPIFFPNPTNGKLFLKGTMMEKSHVYILDLSGRILDKQILPPFRGFIPISVEDIAPGVYVVEWHNQNGVETEKVLIHSK